MRAQVPNINQAVKDSMDSYFHSLINTLQKKTLHCIADRQLVSS